MRKNEWFDDDSFWHELYPMNRRAFFEEIRGSGAPADFAWPPAGKNEYPPQASFRCHMALAVGVEAIQ